jgi:putative phosphoesterase
MRIGIVSDTHNNLKNCRKIVELFNNAAVERVIHTGDITQAKTIEVFADLDAPMFGVFGNNDCERDSLEAVIMEYGFHFIDPPMTLTWAEREIVIVHDPLELDMVDRDDYELILHGHTHQLTIEHHGPSLTFNPGECAGMMEGFNSIGLLDLVDMKPEIINF